ncbi:UDP-GlcNAc--UDP-phosphate GlcNAc-1-phosphate transferase [Tenacibaculum sp. Bg11-29]|uniref:UDP-GlcNAc--UDP-phosphate GlcNAc-1-phosphate transferase n=1 Tax=Tenacibaculum sp. Bg11-29 TaxID=2058306 RepID=UPI000C33DC5E|nr:UDP-GlcNAc--UDP-phosphate GlcNAc-1-phosphate transferase [Tenacibaculum sp. Bg11-29]PKH50437.1 UDP-GlcNAc--UDP-phosphate GlcNAc-1-phosphate transferase [Tenacibaculum sp. Bg11-29]
MIEYFIVLISLIFLSIIYFRLANKFNIIDKPNHRSSHTMQTVRGGGVLFFLAVLIYFFLSDFQYPFFVIGISLIAIVSFIDDIVTLSSTIRLPFQFISIGFCLIQIGFTASDFLLFIPFLIIGVGFINIYNFMDGINGITGLYSIVILLGLFFINLNEHIIDHNLIIYVILSLLVFGFYNFRKKARMFAGDIGSISISVLIFFIGVCFMKELKSPILLLFVLIYGVDAILTLGYRKSIGENVMEPHRKHIYQKLIHIMKLSHLKVAVLYASTQVLICIIIYFGYTLSVVNQLIIMLFCISVFILVYLILFKMIERRKLLSV